MESSISDVMKAYGDNDYKRVEQGVEIIGYYDKKNQSTLEFWHSEDKRDFSPGIGGLTLALEYGLFPWISLSLALTFAKGHFHGWDSTPLTRRVKGKLPITK